MRSKFLAVILLPVFLFVIFIPACGGGGGGPNNGKLVVGNIEGPDIVNEGGTAVQYHVTASGDTGINYQWAVEPAGAGTFKVNGVATTGFIATPRASDLDATIKCVVTSDNGGPVIQNKNITIVNSDNLTVSEIIGPASVGENSTTAYRVEASGDTGIEYQWEVVQTGIGDFTNPKSPECLFNAGSVTTDTQVTIRVRVQSDNYPEIVRQLQVTVMDVNQLIVGLIEGLTNIPELTTTDYHVEAMGDTGITYLWEIIPSSVGAFNNMTKATASLSTDIVHEDMPAQIKVTVNSEHYGPEVRTLDILIDDSNMLVVGEIDGPLVIDEGTSVDYYILAGGDTGITYQWSVVPPDVAIISGETTSTLNIEAPDVDENVELTISVIVDSNNYGPEERGINATIKNIVLIVGEIEGPDPVNENSTANFHLDAEGDTGINFFWEISPTSAGYFEFMYQPTTTLHTDWAGAGESVEIKCTVNSNDYGPEVRTRTVGINDTYVLWVGVVEGPPTVDEDATVNFTVDAVNDSGITYNWYCDPPNAGVLTNEDTETVSFTANIVDADTPALIYVEVSSDHYTPEIRKKDFTVKNLVLDVGDISGPSAMNETEEDNFFINASGDTGITYQWEVDPPDAGSLANPTTDVMTFTAGPIWEPVEATIWCTVDADHNDPVQMSTSVDISDTVVLTATEIDGPVKVDENEDVQYAVTAAGDTGIAYAWEINPPGAGIFSDPGAPNPLFTPAITGMDVDATITCTISGDNYADLIRTLDVKIWPLADHGWVVPAGGTGSDRGYGVSADAAGNVYAIGYFSGTVDFDAGQGTADLISNGLYDCYLAKYSNAGKLIWAVSWGSTNNDEPRRIITDAAGNSYVTGYYQNSCDFDPGPDTYQFTSMGYADAFLEKFDSDGNFEWVNVWGGSGSDCGLGVTIDPSGNSYITGYFEGTVDFDPTPSVDQLSSNGYEDVFLAKYNASGNYQWAVSWGGSNDDDGYGVALDSSQNILVGGRFRGAVDFDPDPDVYQLIAINGDDDAFISKFNSSGAHEWAVNWDAQYASSVGIDSSDSIYACGTFDGTVDFDPSPGVSDFASLGSDDAYLTKLDPVGNFVWARTWGGSSGDYGNRLSIDTSDNIYVIGSFKGTVDFDPGAGFEEYTSAGDYDGFVNKFLPSGSQEWAATWGGTAEDQGYSLAAYSDQYIYLTGWYSGTCDFAPGTDVEEYSSEGDTDLYVLKILFDGTW